MAAPKKPPRQSNRKELFFRLGMLVFASAWMFFLGVLVGRGTAPVRFDIDKIQKELAALKQSSITQEIKRYKINAPETQQKPDLGFHQALKQPEEIVPPAPKPAPPKPAKPKPAPKQVKAAEVKKTPPKKDENESSVKAMAESGTVYTIQVASSKDRAIADRMVARLKQKKYPAYLETAILPDKGIWYRIRIGEFRDRESARQYLDTLNKNNLKGIVIKR